MKPALDDLTVPAPIGAEEEDTGPATLAMAAAALDETEAASIVQRLVPAHTCTELARAGLELGYHAHLHTPEPHEVDDTSRQAGLVVHSRADVEAVARALAARHPVIVSAPGDGPPFLLVLRESDDEIVVDDPSVEQRPLAWSWARLGELLDAEPAPRVLELGARTRADR